MIRLILSYANQQQVKPQKEEEFYQLVNKLKQHLFTNYQLNPQLK